MAAKARTLTISVETEAQARAAVAAAAKRIDAGKGYQGEHFSFTSLPLLFTVFSVKRWEVIEALQRLGRSSLRGLARALERDVKRVHEDVAVLLEEGIIERDADKKLFVPFSEIRVEAELKSPAAA